MWSDDGVPGRKFQIFHFHAARSRVYLRDAANRVTGEEKTPPKKRQMPVRSRTSLLPTSQTPESKSLSFPLFPSPGHVTKIIIYLGILSLMSSMALRSLN